MTPTSRWAAVLPVAALVLGAGIVLAWQPSWREYVGEVVVGLLLLGCGQVLRQRLQARFPPVRASWFDAASSHGTEPLRVPAQFSAELRSASLLGGPATVEQRTLLATTARRRLAERHGCDLESERARALLGDDVQHLLLGATPVLSADAVRHALDVLEGL